MLANLVEKLPVRAAVLDLSYGSEGFARHFTRHGFRVTVVRAITADKHDSTLSTTHADVVEKFIRNTPSHGKDAPQRYDLVILRNILPFIDPTILEDLPRWISAHGYLYLRTFAEDDAVSQQHQFVPPEYIETALEGFVKVEDRSFWEQEAPATTAHPHHVIEMLFCKA